jgi:prolyl-tRNA editing enzyme YbaK/EbsC (Cys-tRNA(Pro) deacylase)
LPAGLTAFPDRGPFSRIPRSKSVAPPSIDLWLDRHPRVWAGAGQPHLVFATTFAELAAVTGGEPAEVGAE